MATGKGSGKTTRRGGHDAPADGTRRRQASKKHRPSSPTGVTRPTVLEGVRRLSEAYPDAHIMLEYADPWQLLVATILSAQSTDKGVNKVTGALFEKYRAIDDYASADPAEFEQDIRATGFFRNKTKSVLGSARRILADFGGTVPDTMEDLITLPGVARKTANIVLSNAFGKVEGIAVDTHVFRLAHRLGWSRENDPNKVEADLMRLIPREDWYAINYMLIDHGRAVCNAQRPKCDACALADICPSAFTFPPLSSRGRSAPSAPTHAPRAPARPRDPSSGAERDG